MSHDIVLLTETWTNEFSEIYVNVFEAFALHRKKNKRKSKRNSGGWIILYIRDRFVSADTLICTSHDDFLWIKVSKAVLAMNSDLYISFCYVTPGDIVASLSALIENISILLICDDFNGRTSNYADFVEDDGSVHMSVLPYEHTLDRYKQRDSEGVGHVNNNGLLLLDFVNKRV